MKNYFQENTVTAPELLRKSILSVLAEAECLQSLSIAFPIDFDGNQGFPLSLSIEVVLSAVLDHFEMGLSCIQCVFKENFADISFFTSSHTGRFFLLTPNLQ